MKIEIEVPDEIEHNGKRYRPTGEYRPPLRNEVALDGCGEVFQARNDYDTLTFVILEEIPDQPKARDAIKPFEHGGRWFFADCGRAIRDGERVMGYDCNYSDDHPWFSNDGQSFQWRECTPQIPDDDTQQLVYLASPYSSTDVLVEHTRWDMACNHTALQHKLGRKVFSPIAHGRRISDYIGGSCWKTFKEFSLFMLAMSSKLEVLKLDGWEESIGVQAEIAFAQEKGIPVVYVDL